MRRVAKDQPSASFRGDASASERVQPKLPIETLESRLLVGLALVFAILTAVVYLAIRNTLQTRETSVWINNTHAVILEASAILGSLNALEAAQAAYLVRGTQSDLESWRRSLSELKEHLQVAEALTAGNTSQQKLFSRLKPLVERRVEFSEKVVDVRNKDGEETARRLFQGSSTTDPGEKVEAVVALLTRDENVLLARRDQESVANAKSTRRILGAGLVLNGALLIGGYFLVRDDLKLRRLHAAQLGRMNDVLEQMVHARTSQLADANEALTIENLERKWAYFSLEKNYRHGQLIIESLSEMVLLVGATGLIHQGNPAAESAVQGASSKLIGSHLCEFLAPSEHSCAWSDHPVKKAMRSNTPLQDQPGWLLASGRPPAPVIYNLKPIEDSGQVVMAIIGIRFRGLHC